MTRMTRYGGLLTLAIAILIFGAPAYGQMSVMVSIAPQKYFVQQICKDLADVQIMVPPGSNPATYEPKPRQMAAISKTRIYFSIGVPFENAWLKKISAANPDMAVVPTDRGIPKVPMVVGHSHAGEKKSVHGILDPHIWLSPPLVRHQAQAILDAVQATDPGHRSVYESNFKAFMVQVSNLDAELKRIFSQSTGQRFMVFHPSWGYFARAYGLKQVPIEVEGKEPKPAQLRQLIETAREDGIQFIFVQPQFSIRSARVIAGEIGAQVVIADPLAEDWADNLRAVARQFAGALK